MINSESIFVGNIPYDYEQKELEENAKALGEVPNEKRESKAMFVN